MYKRLLKAIKIIGVYSGFIYSIRKKPKYHFKPSFLSTHSKALEEIKKNFYETGITQFEFTDSLINGSTSNFNKFNELLIKEKGPSLNFPYMQL